MRAIVRRFLDGEVVEMKGHRNDTHVYLSSSTIDTKVIA